MSSERIKNLASANSSTWGSKEEEKEQRAKIHEAQKKRGQWMKDQQDEQNNIVQEVAEADRQAIASRKRKTDDEVSQMLQAQKDDASAQPKLGIQFAAQGKPQETAKSRLSRLVVVKKQRTVEAEAEAEAAPPPAAGGSTGAGGGGPAEPTPAAAGDTGGGGGLLGGYSSDEASSEE